VTGRAIPDPGHAGDDGSADAELAARLSAYAAGVGDLFAVHRALAATRVLVPIVAARAESESTSAGGRAGLTGEKTSDMAVVTVVGRDGRTALPVFTAVDTLARWRPDARPVPLDARRAALAAYDEQADALIVDIAGPVRHVVRGPALRALAEGRELRPAHDDPEVLAAIRRAAASVDSVTAVYAAPGQDADLRVTLGLAEGLAQEEMRRAAGTVADLLSADPVLRARLCAGLDLAVLPPGAIPPANPL
jgi:SseB protein N-terminal domain